MMKDRTHYQSEDFADDDYFIAWIKRPDAVSDHFWQQYILTHPAQAPAIDQAREMVLSLAAPHHFSDEEKAQLWHTIQHNIPEPRRRLAAMRYSRYAAAAVLAFVFVLAGLLARQYMHDPGKTVHSAYAQKRQVTLSDGSIVVLNANSILKYPQQFKPGSVREVWLEGEAFFDVKHLNKNEAAIKTHERFVVHTTDMDIEVLGTSFNVLRRHDNTKVSLINGRVQLKLDGITDEPVMKPGESIDHADGERVYHKTTGKTAAAIAWMDNKIILDNTPLSEVARKIEDHYGVHVQLQSKQLAGEKLSGEIPANNLQVLIAALDDVLKAKVKKEGNKIIISE